MFSHSESLPKSHKSVWSRSESVLLKTNKQKDDYICKSEEAVLSAAGEAKKAMNWFPPLSN